MVVVVCYQAEDDYGGSVSRLTDIVRNSIVLDTEEDVAKLLRVLLGMQVWTLADSAPVSTYSFNALANWVKLFDSSNLCSNQRPSQSEKTKTGFVDRKYPSSPRN